MSHGVYQIPTPLNEPVRGYAPGSPERASLARELERQRAEIVEIPLLIGGREVRTGKTVNVVMPHQHGHVLARAHQAGPGEVQAAIEAAEAARPAWEGLPFEARAAVLLKAAELLAGPWRDRVNAATMLGQSKTCHQAEIDSACELIDFWRFNPAFAQQLYGEQPRSAPGTWNRMEHRALDGFVLAITPFNFTSIAGNLPSAPALLGNTVLWKPSETSLLSNWYVMRVLQEAGLPPGVLNFLPSRGSVIGPASIPDRRFAGLHFTGSTATFRNLWRQVGDNLERYRAYPRLVGETGGKDFVFAHPSADNQALAVALLRGAFEYQGQKCSAASRAYIPKSLWGDLHERLRAGMESMRMGDPSDFQNFIGAVIDRPAFDQHAEAIAAAQESKDADVLIGGRCDASRGYFVEPTVILAKHPRYDTMLRELFGPILTVFVYDDQRLDEALQHCAEDSEYALTGAIFAQERGVIEQLSVRLRSAAGNFYINDKPTGAVVGQQPFGGSRASGTNDKAGSILNLLRWTSPRAIKETFVPPTDWRYPFLG
jgi:1-pyrroline-5-carboxylate dehydrogenase